MPPMSFTAALGNTHHNFPRDHDTANIPVDRVIFTTVSMLCTIAISILFGFRAKNVKFRDLASLGFIRICVLVMYMTGLIFTFITALANQGFGENAYHNCHYAIRICTIFYFLNKVAMYITLTERAHVITAPYQRRVKDPAWVGCMVVTFIGVTLILTLASLWPTHQISSVDGECRIGFPIKVSVPMLAYDMFMNLAFTALFVHMLYPFISAEKKEIVSARDQIVCKSRLCKIVHVCRCKYKGSVTGQLRILARKTAIGGILMMVSTVVNIVVLVLMKGHQKEWFCLTLCTVDVTWTAIILHWLTVDPTDNGCNVPSHRHLATRAQESTLRTNRTIREVEIILKDERDASMSDGGPDSMDLQLAIYPTTDINTSVSLSEAETLTQDITTQRPQKEDEAR